jgi:CHAT domain-containing protein
VELRGVPVRCLRAEPSAVIINAQPFDITFYILGADLNTQGQSNDLLEQGKSLFAAREFYRALEVFQQAQDMAIGLPSEFQARIANEQGKTLRALGQLRSALERHQRALELRRQAFAGDHPEIASSLNNVGINLDALGRYADALSHKRQSLEMRERLFGSQDLSDQQQLQLSLSLNNLAETESVLGFWGEALEHHQRALELRRGLSDLVFQGRLANSLDNIGNLHTRMGDLEQASVSYLEAFEIREQLGDLEKLAVSHSNLGANEQLRGNNLEARAHFQRSLELCEMLDGPESNQSRRAIALVNLAANDLLEKQPELALERSHIAYGIFEGQLGPDHPYSSDALETQGEAMLGQDATSALEHFLRACQARLRHAQDQLFIGMTRPQRQAWNQQIIPSIARMFAMICDANLVGQLEPLKDQVLETWLTFKGSTNILKNALVTLEHRLMQTATPEAKSLLEDLQVLRDLRSQMARDEAADQTKRLEAEQLEQDLMRRSRWLQDELNLRFVRLEDLRQYLGPDDLMIDFAVLEHEVYAIGIPKLGSVVIKRLSLDLLDVYSTLDTFRDAIQPAGSDAGQTLLNLLACRAEGRAARKLFEALLRPLQSLLAAHATGNATRVSRLIISGTDRLYFVPWELLHDGTHFLIELFEITQLPTPRDLIRLGQAPSVQADGASVLLGNPDFLLESAQHNLLSDEELKNMIGTLETRASDADDSSEDRLRTISPDRVSTVFSQAQSGSAARGFEPDPKRWPLSGSGQEIKAVRTLLPKSIVLTDDRATRENLEQAVNILTETTSSAPFVLHLSTHAAFLDLEQAQWLFSNTLNDSQAQFQADPQADPSNPFSRAVLFLTGGFHRAHSQHGPGVIRAWDLAGMCLRGTQLVNLSACDTAQGTPIAGEGIAGLVQALFMAGSRRVLSTLWPVFDRATATFMHEFYSAWLETPNNSPKTTPSAALREVKLRWLAKGREPAYWAGFVLNGTEVPFSD